MNEIRISRIQTMYLLFWLIMATGILTMPLAIAHFTIRDGWMAGLLFGVGTLISAGVCALYLRSFPNTSLTDALGQVFGPYIGRTMGLWFIVWLGINTAMMSRQFLVFAEVCILPRTPLPMIELAFFLPVAYAVFLGLETLGRFCEFVTPVACIIIGIIIAMSIGEMHLNALQPILADGWAPVFKSALQPGTSFAFQLMLFLQLVPNLRNSRSLAWSALIVGLIIAVLLFIIEVVIISVLGGSANYLQFPLLEVVRGIQIGRFIQRLDTIYVMGIIAVIFIKVSIYQYLFMSSIHSVFQLNSMQTLVLPTTAVTGAASIFLWHDTAELSHYMLFVTPAYFIVTLLGLPLLAVIGRFVRKRAMTVTESSGAS